MGHDLLELLEFLDLEQEKHIVLQNESIARRHVDSLFERHLRVLCVARLLKSKCQVAECLLIILFYLQCVEESDCSVFEIALLELQSSKVHDRTDVAWVSFVGRLEHLLSV